MSSRPAYPQSSWPPTLASSRRWCRVPQGPGWWDLSAIGLCGLLPEPLSSSRVHHPCTHVHACTSTPPHIDTRECSRSFSHSGSACGPEPTEPHLLTGPVRPLGIRDEVPPAGADTEPADAMRGFRGQALYLIKGMKPLYDHKPKHKRRRRSEDRVATPEEGNPGSRWPGTAHPRPVALLCDQLLHPRGGSDKEPTAAGRPLRELKIRSAAQERGPTSEPTTPQASDPGTAPPRAHAGCREGRATD